MCYKLFDRLLRLVKLFPPLEKLILLIGETIVLLKSLLVDMLVFLERVIDLL
jgi:hypothetical protein